MRSRKTKTPLIRVGDTVRIVTPEFFVRCGYPLGFADVAAKVRADHGGAIEAFLKSVGVRYPDTSFEPPPRSVDKVVKAVAFDLLKLAGHGGRERRIHTVTFPGMAGCDSVVTGVRFVKTGDYQPRRTYGGYDGYDHDPAYLANEQTHRLLETTLYGTLPHGAFDEPLWIEAANVELATA